MDLQKKITLVRDTGMGGLEMEKAGIYVSYTYPHCLRLRCCVPNLRSLWLAFLFTMSLDFYTQVDSKGCYQGSGDSN